MGERYIPLQGKGAVERSRKIWLSPAADADSKRPCISGILFVVVLSLLLHPAFSFGREIRNKLGKKATHHRQHNLSMPFHKFVNVFTAESPRTQRVSFFFYPTVRGGRIRSSLSASDRDLGKAFASKRRRLLLWRPLTAGAKKPSSLRPLRLCGEQRIC